MQRIVLPLTIFLLTCAAFAEADPCGSDSEMKVFVAKKIITMDPGWPVATAVAVKNGRIVSVGDDLKQLEPWTHNLKPCFVTDFKDKVLMPGFVEPHQHPVVGGLGASLPYVGYDPTVTRNGSDGVEPGYRTKQEVLRRITQLSNNIPKVEIPLLVFGYDIVAQGKIRKGELEKISCTHGIGPQDESKNTARCRPIALWAASEHVIYANEAWINLLPADVRPLAKDGVFEGPPQVAKAIAPLTDSLKEKLPLGQRRVYCVMPETAQKGVEFVQALNSYHGITTMSDLDLGASGNPDYELAIEYPYFDHRDVPMRLAIVSDGEVMAEKHSADPTGFVHSLKAMNTDKVFFGGIKFYADDAFVSLGMQLDFPGYIPHHPEVASPFWNNSPGQVFAAKMFPWWKAGFDIHVHSVGDKSQDALLDALAMLQQQYPRFDHRFTFEHYGISRPDQARRMKSLGAAASANIYYLYLRGYINVDQIGTDRSYLTARLKTLFDAGVPTALHSDFPVAVPDPLLALQTALDRFSLKDHAPIPLPIPLAPKERITLEQGLQAITTNPAYVLRMDDKVGSIEAGKFADFVVLDKDPTEVFSPGHNDPMAHGSIKIVATIVGGRIFPTKEPKYANECDQSVSERGRSQ